MKNLLFSIAIAALLVGCAGVGSQINTATDRFTNTTINQTTGNDLPSLADNFITYFNVRQEVNSTGARYLLCLSSFSLSDYILIPQPFGDSLFVIADNDRFSFPVSNQQGKVFFYEASEAQIRSICYATNVEIRIIQPNGVAFEKKLAAKNRSNFKEFADKFIAK